MSTVVVVHPDLSSKGGGESVAMAVVEALQADHDVTLLTLSDPDVGELNEYFNADVDAGALDVERAGVLAPAVHDRVGSSYYVLQAALLARYARRRADEFDLVVSTVNELGLPAESVEYVHFPFDWTASMSGREEVFHPTIRDGSLYERLCTRVADVSVAGVREGTHFANSEWTAEKFADAYGLRPPVLHPPVDTEGFEDVPWSDREAGFVTVGRIEPSKRVVEVVRIVDGVRERGHDVHLHVLGPAYDREYAARVRTMAADREYVEVEGEVDRSELVERISTHRYGIHGKEHEHFGMAVAETVAGGAIPFVPASGGQRALVRDDPRLLYDSSADAVDTIDAVLGDRALQRELRRRPAEIEREFGRERFQARIRRTAADVLDLPAPDLPASPARLREKPRED